MSPFVAAPGQQQSLLTLVIFGPNTVTTVSVTADQSRSFTRNYKGDRLSSSSAVSGVGAVHLLIRKGHRLPRCLLRPGEIVGLAAFVV